MSNITNNRLNVVLQQTDIAAVGQSMTDIKTTLNFLIGLEKDEKNGMVGISASNKLFVEDCLNEMDVEPGILPTFIDPQWVRNDYDLFQQLETFKISLQDLLDKVSDTQFLAGAEAYAVCLIYYRLVEAAAKAGLPGADERYNRLKQRFAAQGGSPTQPGGGTGSGTTDGPVDDGTTTPTP